MSNNLSTYTHATCAHYILYLLPIQVFFRAQTTFVQLTLKSLLFLSPSMTINVRVPFIVEKGTSYKSIEVKRGCACSQRRQTFLPSLNYVLRDQSPLSLLQVMFFILKVMKTFVIFGWRKSFCSSRYLIAYSADVITLLIPTICILHLRNFWALSYPMVLIPASCAQHIYFVNPKLLNCFPFLVLIIFPQLSPQPLVLLGFYTVFPWPHL